MMVNRWKGVRSPDKDVKTSMAVTTFKRGDFLMLIILLKISATAPKN